jgi:hypothetical protein
MNIKELKRLAEAATPGPWAHGVTWIEHLGGIVVLGNTARSKQDVAYVSAANPAAVLELIAEIEYLRGKNREHFDACTGSNEPNQPGSVYTPVMEEP